ncbi:hypothetical protein H2201_006696 [Coniosporium apollinis]|uniref:Kinetochore protein Sos7 coiled-coil domain-containing protein n=1 Tax=Coniosporium apollinis TaxID=61459 RepID=A0ABQ9NL40_9PEZI|nr:hypothetical protein H2201_006696 [Coniosporium apollinis]
MDNSTNIDAALAELQQSKPLSIIKLSDAFYPESPQNAQKRNSGVSDVSASALENATPASLEADLTHYKELFSKLRFSYVEQVTKEKFLRAIVSDDPPFVEPQENAELEALLAEQKALLKAQKAEVADMIAELERRGRELSKRMLHAVITGHEAVQLQAAQLATLPTEIANLESTIASLRESQAPHPTNSSLSLPLPATLELLSSREAEIAALDTQLASLQAALPRRTQELERLERELRPLEMQKQGTVAAAKEARRRREAGVGGLGDELDEKARWLRTSEKMLREMLGVEV